MGMTIANVFSPRTEDGKVRLLFDCDTIRVISGGLFIRGRGRHATVDIGGHRFAVFGASCGLPHCMCDATIKYEGECQ
jgi:hypothetical protein